MTNSAKKVGKERKDMQKNNELNDYISTITNNFNNTILKIKDIEYHYYLDKLLTAEFNNLKEKDKELILEELINYYLTEIKNLKSQIYLKEISKQVNDIIDFFNFHKDDLKDNIDYCSIIEEAEDIASDLYSKVTNVNDRNIELPIKITFLKSYCISSNIKDNDIIRVLTWIVLKLSVIYHCLPKQTINCSR